MSARSDEELRDFRERRNRRREADSLEVGTALRAVRMRVLLLGRSAFICPTRRTARSAVPTACQRRKPLHAQREMCAAFVLSERVNLINNEPARMTERREPFFLAEQQAEALGCRQENVRKSLKLPRALARRRVARAQLNANRRLFSESLWPISLA